MFNIAIGLVCLWMAQDSLSNGTAPKIFDPLGIILGVINISWGVISMLQ